MTHNIQHILVTGGCGFIGSNFIRLVFGHRTNIRVTNLDKLTYAGRLENLEDIADDPRYTFIRGDICDRDVVEQAMTDCDCVVHFAAESHVDRSINDASPFITTNVLGTQVLLDVALENAIDRFVQIGTDEVYGELPLDKPEVKFTEDTPLAPRSPYSASKAAGDMLALAYQHTHNLPVMVTRCSNNFGPHQFPEKVIPLFVTNLIEGRRVPLYGDGLNVRDWLHVIDHCEAVLAVLERGRPGRVYNIGGNNERSNLELTHAILDAMDCDESMIEQVPDRLGHDRRYAINASRIADELGWQPTRSAWPDALLETIDWYRNHEAWWRTLKTEPCA